MIMSNPSLPPGFRFHPTDEELILHYLRSRTASAPCPVAIIADVDIYKFDPWDLPSKAVYGDREWYFFSPRDRKYPNGIRPNRAAGSGYWKATGTDKPIHDGANENIGVKKALVFYKGRPPRGTKTNWIMHEYRLAADPRADAGRSSSYKPTSRFQNVSMRLDDWVLCRIYKKSSHEAPMAAPPPLADHEEDVLYGFDVNRLNAPPLPPSGAVYMPWMPEPLDEYTLAQLFDSDCTAVPAETEHHLPLLGYHFVDELLANNSVPQLADTDYSSSSASSTAAVGDGSGKRKLSSQEDGSDHGSLVGHHEAKRPNTSCFDAAFSAALTQLPAGLRDQTALFDRF